MFDRSQLSEEDKQRLEKIEQALKEAAKDAEAERCGVPLAVLPSSNEEK